MNNQHYIQTLCENIRKLRHQNDLSIEEMAARLNISEEMLTTLENGRLPDDLEVESLVRIEKEFGISLKELFLPL